MNKEKINFNPSHANPGRTEKIKKALKAFVKTFEGPQRCEKKKFNSIFILIQLSEMHGPAGGVKIDNLGLQLSEMNGAGRVNNLTFTKAHNTNIQFMLYVYVMLLERQKLYQ